MQGAEVEIIDETAEEFEDDGVKLIRRVLNESDPELSITDADIIVAGGRGMVCRGHKEQCCRGVTTWSKSL